MPTTENRVGSDSRRSPGRSATNDLRPGAQVGEYLVSQKIGEGGMATVYGAVHPIIGKRAAIKVLAPWLSSDADQVDRFVQEARAVNAIGHPNIVEVFAFGRLPDGRAYFIMEWLQGRSLESLSTERPLSLELTFDIIDQICEALAAAHEKGIVHCDLKPANVFLAPVRDGRTAVKLLDFGVAKLTCLLEGMTELRAQTATGMVAGTPEYLSPEQACGQELDGRSDLYSLGVMLYELVLGKRPFESANIIDVLRMQLSQEPPPPSGLWPEIPPALETLLLGLLAKEPALRPSIPEVRAVILELRATPLPATALASQPTTGAWKALATPMVTPLPRPHRKGRRRWAIAAALFAGVAMLALTLRHRASAVEARLTTSPSYQVWEATSHLPRLHVPLETRSEMAAPARKPSPSRFKARVRLASEPEHAHTNQRDLDYLVDPFGAQQ